MMEQWVAWVSSFLLGVSGAWVVIQKFSPKARKALKISAETIELIEEILSATDDQKIEKHEVELILKRIGDLQAALK